ncbi:MAG: hypothetical protein IPN29_07775 [Saprospiraceae bacterium]|nr:hypothetical protein [Saprospiraceae bacterium]
MEFENFNVALTLEPSIYGTDISGGAIHKVKNVCIKFTIGFTVFEKALLCLDNHTCVAYKRLVIV